MSRSNQFPMVGDRVGSVCGPGEFPKDNAGTVVRVYADRWYDNNADIVYDDGRTDSWVGAYCSVGIGVHLIERAKVAA